MVRRLCWLLILPMILSPAGCSGSGDLPTVPPPPPEGTVKAASSSPGTLPPEAIKKLSRKAAKLKDSSPEN